MTAPAGWYPATDRDEHERYWDGTEWTTAYRRLSVPAEVRPKPIEPLTPWSGTKKLTPAGRVVRIAALGAFAGGLYVGYGMPASSIGVDGTSVEDLTNAHPVDCGSAFQVKFSSVNCEQALSGRKTTATVLLILGATGSLAATVGMKEKLNSDG